MYKGHFRIHFYIYCKEQYLSLILSERQQSYPAEFVGHEVDNKSAAGHFLVQHQEVFQKTQPGFVSALESS